MRVIAGAWRGRPLVAPAGAATRPTADRVRESLFSMLASRIGDFDDLAVIDLYAGSGALGIEALSRGAASCTFVDNDRNALIAIRANLDRLGAGSRATVIAGTVGRLPPIGPADLVFADPPYAPGSGTSTVALASAMLAAGGWLAIETARGDAIDAGPLERVAERDIGRARITLLRRA